VLHNQDEGAVRSVRETLQSVGVRLDRLPEDLMLETLQELPDYVKRHNLPYTILHNITIDEAHAREILQKAKLIS
jgi:hypothetical protein